MRQRASACSPVGPSALPAPGWPRSSCSWSLCCPVNNLTQWPKASYVPKDLFLQWGARLTFVFQVSFFSSTFGFFASVDFEEIRLIFLAEMYFRKHWNKDNHFFFFLYFTAIVIILWRIEREVTGTLSGPTDGRLQAMISTIAGLLFMMLIPNVCSSLRHPSKHLLLPLEVPEHFHIDPRTMCLPILLKPVCVLQELLMRMRKRIMLLWSLLLTTFLMCDEI